MKQSIFHAGAMAAFMVLASTVFLGSCSSDENTITDSTAKDMLTVSITPSNSVRTRAAITTNPTDGTESTINQFTVAIFDKDGKLEKLDKMSMSGNTQLTTDATSLTEGDSVFVAVNCPATLFDDVSTASEGDTKTDKERFLAKTLTIAKALWGNPTHGETAATITDHADNNYIPMFGKGAIAKAEGSTNRFTADINVYHLLSKVSVSSINVDFSDTYSGATFTPVEIFMANVPTTLGFGITVDGQKYSYAAQTTYVSGESTTVSDGTASVVSSPSYPLLSSGVLSLTGTTEASKTTYSKDLPIFYTLPNNKTVSGENGATFLVIKGKFTYNGSTEVCYYPIFLNFNTNKTSVVPDSHTAKCLMPNYNYRVSVYITGKGSDSPVKPVDGSSATISTKVSDFQTANQTSTDEQ